MPLAMPGTVCFSDYFRAGTQNQGDKYDTCVINKIRIWVDVFGKRKRGEMEINRHFYSTAHFLPKQQLQKQVW